MKTIDCRTFERDAADWLAGRLQGARDEAMEAHCTQCKPCARILEREGAIRDAWRVLADQPAPDLWPRLAARMADGRLDVPRPQRLAWLFGWFSGDAAAPRRPLRGLTVAGAAMAACGLAAVMLLAPHGPSAIGPAPAGSNQAGPTIAAVDEQHVVQLVSDMTSPSEPDGALLSASPDETPHAARTVLLGSNP